MLRMHEWCKDIWRRNGATRLAWVELVLIGKGICVDVASSNQDQWNTTQTTSECGGKQKSGWQESHYKPVKCGKIAHHNDKKISTSAVSGEDLSTGNTTSLLFSEWKLCVIVNLNMYWHQEGDKRRWLQWACIFVVTEKPNQTHAVYTHCCSTHDQHQESPHNAITQREKRRVQWQSNKW